MSQIRIQHYVPRAYLWHWAHMGKLVTLDISADRTFGAYPGAVAAERDFYNSPDEPDLEGALARFDDDLATIQRRLIVRSSISLGDPAFVGPVVPNDDRWPLARCIALQMLRTRHAGNHLSVEDPQEERLRHLEFIANDGLLRLARSFTDNYVWVLGTNATGIPLYTSDMPAIPTQPLDDPPGGGAPRFAEVLFPLSPSHILVLCDRSYHFEQAPWDGNGLELRAENVVLFNTYQAAVCHRFLFSPVDQFEVVEWILQARGVKRTA